MGEGVGAQGECQVTPQPPSASDAQTQEEWWEDSLEFTLAEKESVECMLTGHYGLPLVISAQELRLEDGKCGDHVVTENELVFTLTQSQTIVHPLQDVARTHLCCVDLD